MLGCQASEVQEYGGLDASQLQAICRTQYRAEDRGWRLEIRVRSKSPQATIVPRPSYPVSSKINTILNRTTVDLSDRG